MKNISKYFVMKFLRVMELVAGISLALTAGQRDVLLVMLGAVIFCDALFNLIKK